MKATLLIISLTSLLLCQQAFSASGPGDIAYPATAIPENLKKGANAVIRHESTTFKIISAAKAVTIEEKVITILNPRGLGHASHGVGYDKLSKILKLEGQLLGADGKLIRKLKSSDISDHSATGDNLISDNRYKVATLNHVSYPYTVIWRTEVETTNMMFYPSWQPPVREKVAVEQASFQVVCPPGLGLRHVTYQLSEPEIVTENNGVKKYSWSSANLAVAEEEPYADYWKSSPYVLLAPTTFEVEGYKGSMETWQQMGIFMNELNKNRDILPVEVINQVKSLTSKCITEREKVKVIYEFMQQHTRYVSIQLGIGGWQPFEASFVNKKGYGDCKALSNYTKALLKAVGIEAYYTLIQAGADGTKIVNENFSKSYFNHVIIGVPLEQDTIWLECTSQTNPFNHQGSSTGNRKALMVTPNGGKLVNTRFYSVADNLQTSKVTIDLQQEKPHYQLLRTYRGIQFDEPSAYMRAMPDKQKEWLHDAAALPDIQLENYKLTEQKEQEPVMVLEVKAKLQTTYRSGNRLFLPLNPGKFPLEVPKPIANRKTDFVQEWGYTFSDTLTYLIPATYKVEHLPEAQELKSRFGDYTIKVEQQAGKLVCISTLRLNDGNYPATDYQEWVNFIHHAAGAHSAKAVLVQH